VTLELELESIAGDPVAVWRRGHRSRSDKEATIMANAHVGTLEGETRTSMELIAGGSIAETIGGAATCVLAIVGLSGILSADLAAVATIAAGAALALEGTSILTRYTELLQEIRADASGEIALGGGMSAESLGGFAVITLGVLALIGVTSTALMSVALIVLGGSLLLSSTATSRLNSLRIAQHRHDEVFRAVAREAVSAASGAQVLLGMGGIVLGILAVVGIDPLTLVLIGLLATGFSVLLSGTAVGGKMLSGLRTP
jgi:hypothetical protein